MGCGRVSAFTASIMPFADNPGFKLPVVFYAVPFDNPDGPASPFVDRFWDQRENWVPPGIGMDPTSFAPYFGPVPDGTISPLVGSLDEWANGLSFAKWQAGGYANPNGCVTVQQVTKPQTIRFSLQLVGEEATLKQVWTQPCVNALIPERLTWSATFAVEGNFSGTLVWSRRAKRWESNDAFGLCPAGQLNLTLKGLASGFQLTGDPTGLGVLIPVTGFSCSPFSLTASKTGNVPCGQVGPNSVSVSVTA